MCIAFESVYYMALRTRNQNAPQNKRIHCYCDLLTQGRRTKGDVGVGEGDGDERGRGQGRVTYCVPEAGVRGMGQLLHLPLPPPPPSPPLQYFVDE